MDDPVQAALYYEQNLALLDAEQARALSLFLSLSLSLSLSF